MSQSCSGEESFLNTEIFVTMAFHCLTIFEVPVHIFVGYLILFKTPKRMGNVKWYMFNVHFWSATLDISLSFLVIPYMFFPFAAGYSFGIFKWLGVHRAWQTTVIVIEIGMTIISILVLFENRFTFLASSSKGWTRFRKAFIGVLHVVAWTYFLPFTLSTPDQAIAGPAILQRLPTLRCFYSDDIFVLTQDATLVGWSTVAKLVIEFVFIIILVVLTFNTIIKQNKNAVLSKNTMALQKKFFVSITIQTVIPFFIILVPLCYCGYSLGKMYYNQALNNISFLVISSHGLVSTIAMSLIHEPYRNAIFRFGKRGIHHRTASISFIRHSHLH